MESEQKRLYEHYLATGQTARAEEVLSRYPQFAEKPEVVEEKPVKRTRRSRK